MVAEGGSTGAAGDDGETVVSCTHVAASMSLLWLDGWYDCHWNTDYFSEKVMEV